MQSALENNDPQDEATQIAREYEDFAYIVSHDLNAPLRHVKEFTRLLIGSHKNELTHEEQEYVTYLEKSLKKLDEMQTALLAFSRLNTRSGPLRETNFNHAAAAAIKELDSVISQYFPAIECGDLPTLLAEPQQIQSLFFHLIDNALKFHEGDTEKRKVWISATEQKESWQFEIRDNGIGIDEKHQEDVFRLFRRLEPDKYPGIGAGLTIAQKIVQKHGGDMLIESEPGKGTSVFFSIAKRPV